MSNSSPWIGEVHSLLSHLISERHLSVLLGFNLVFLKKIIFSRIKTFIRHFSSCIFDHLLRECNLALKKKSPDLSLQESQPPDAQHPWSTPAERGWLQCHHGTGDICASPFIVSCWNANDHRVVLELAKTPWKETKRGEKRRGNLKAAQKLNFRETVGAHIHQILCCRRKKKTTSLFEVGWKHNWLVSNFSQTLIWHLLCYIYLFQADRKGRNNVKAWSV